MESEPLNTGALGDAGNIPDGTSAAGDEVPRAEGPGESEPWRVYNGSGTQLYDYDGALIGHLDSEGNVLLGKEARVPADERPVPLLKSFIRWVWGFVGRPAGGATCPRLSRPQTDGACDGVEDLAGTMPGDASGSLGGGVVVDADRDEESGSSAGSESSASVDTEITVPDDEAPGEPWVGAVAMGLVRAQTAPGGFVGSWWSGVGSESAEGAGAGEGVLAGLSGLSGLGGRTLSRTMSA